MKTSDNMKSSISQYDEEINNYFVFAKCFRVGTLFFVSSKHSLDIDASVMIM